MGAWLKLFSDGSSERGSDGDISEGKASWSRGRLRDIDSVYLSDNRFVCVLQVPNTEWYQYDRYMAPLGVVGKNVSIRTARVIQAKIQPEHVGNKIHSKFNGGVLFVRFSNAGDTIISQEHVGLWITVYILNNGNIDFTICQRGAFHGDKQILK